MPNTRQIIQRIKTAGNITKITKAMEMVSASKMRRAQEQALATRPYTAALQHSLSTVVSVTKVATHPMMTPHTEGIPVALIISTDKGLCGSLNPNLFKSVLEWAHSNPNGQVIAVGKKAVAFCRFAGLPLFAQFTDMPDVVKPGDILSISSLVSSHFLDKTFRSVSIIYMDFITTLVQKVRLFQLLPLPKIETVGSIAEPILAGEYIFEPSAQEILAQLLPYYLENSLYQAFLESRASEHSARMVSMKNASDNAKELVGELRLQYNKSRQASITSELLDITTAMLAQN
ncbi:ATP synthase F1 subunit gamma [Candidatus Woesebacteria bacterium]|nr:ATP synthase F1 subunit gamma [Candidatus Woesebacteria bacterium]